MISLFTGILFKEIERAFPEISGKKDFDYTDLIERRSYTLDQDGVHITEPSKVCNMVIDILMMLYDVLARIGHINSGNVLAYTRLLYLIPIEGHCRSGKMPIVKEPFRCMKIRIRGRTVDNGHKYWNFIDMLSAIRMEGV